MKKLFCLFTILLCSPIFHGHVNAANNLDKDLRKAARKEQEAKVKNLLKAGANPNSKHGGKTSLHIAVKKDNAPITKLLLKHGADPKIKDASGNTSLHLVARTIGISSTRKPDAYRKASRNRAKICRLLLKHGADRSIKNKSGKTALDIAIRYLNTRVVTALRQK